MGLKAQTGASFLRLAQNWFAGRSPRFDYGITQLVCVTLDNISVSDVNAEEAALEHTWDAGCRGRLHSVSVQRLAENGDGAKAVPSANAWYLASAESPQFKACRRLLEEESRAGNGHGPAAPSAIWYVFSKADGLYSLSSDLKAYDEENELVRWLFHCVADRDGHVTQRMGWSTSITGIY